MSVSNLERSVSHTAGGVAIGPYTFIFPYAVVTDLKLTVDGLPSTDFTVGDGYFNTGSILPLDTKLVFYRETSLKQETDFPPNSTPSSANVEAAVDKLTYNVQEQTETISRSVTSAIGNENNFVASSTIGLDANGKGVSRTVTEEIAHLGITNGAAAAAVSAAAALASANSASSDAAAVGSPVSYVAAQSLSAAQQVVAQTNLGIPGGDIGQVGGYGSEHIVYIAATAAVSNGAFDSSQFIQDALDSFGDAPVRVIFPAGGNYMCRDLVLRSNTTVELTGCTLKFGGTSPTPSGSAAGAVADQPGMFWAEGTLAAPKTNIHLIGGTLDGLDAGISGDHGSNDAIQLLYCDNVIIENMLIKRWNQDGIEAKDCNNLVIRNNVIDEIWDAGIECRAGKYVEVYGNVVKNVRDGFMTKPHVHATDGTTYATEYHVFNNDFHPRVTGILNNWANDSVFESNRITPWPGSTNVIGITTNEHPVLFMLNLQQYGIVIRNNVFAGTTSNTAFRHDFPSTRTLDNRHEITVYDGNRVEGSAGKAFDLDAWYELKNSFVKIATGEALYSKTQGDCIVTNNDFSAKTTRFVLGDATHHTTVNDNKFAAVVHSVGFIKGRGNEFLSWKSAELSSGLELRESYHNSASTASDWITCYPNNAVLDGLDFTTTGSRTRGVMMYGKDCTITNFSFRSNGASVKEAIELGTITASSVVYSAERGNISNGVSISGDVYGGTAITTNPQIEILSQCIDTSITNVKTFGGLVGFKIYANNCNLIGCRATDASGADIWVLTSTGTHLTHCQVGALGSATLGFDDDSGGTAISTNNRF